jgi:signal recognition particle receptor subunit beta
VKIHLYGTPGQERFDFMWDILQLNIDALILLIGDARRAPQDALGHFLQRFSAVIEKTPTLVVINRFSAHPPPLDVYRAKLASGGFSLPILTIDARIREDLIAVIKCALPLIESHQS